MYDHPRGVARTHTQVEYWCLCSNPSLRSPSPLGPSPLTMSLNVGLSLSLSLSHTHTHTNTHSINSHVGPLRSAAITPKLLSIISLGSTYYCQVGYPNWRYEFVKSGAETSSGSPNWRSQNNGVRNPQVYTPYERKVGNTVGTCGGSCRYPNLFRFMIWREKPAVRHSHWTWGPCTCLRSCCPNGGTHRLRKSQ